MKFENTNVFNIKGAILGARNPMNSWDKSDSHWCDWANEDDCKKCKEYCLGEHENQFYIVGDNDLRLMQNLIKAGDSDAKFLRQIFVTVDITAPLYWWKEMDQYKVSTTTNSCSTMHKLMSTPITVDCFETDDLQEFEKFELNHTANVCESYRQLYLETKDRKYWKSCIRLLPESWLQMRTWTGSYANVRNMYFQRNYHKLSEWSVSAMKWIDKLPYSKEFIKYSGEN